MGLSQSQLEKDLVEKAEKLMNDGFIPVNILPNASIQTLQTEIAKAENFALKWPDRLEKIRNSGLKLGSVYDYKRLSDEQFEQKLQQTMHLVKRSGLLVQVLPLVHGGFLPVLDGMDPDTMGYSKLSICDLESRISSARQCQANFIKRVIQSTADEVEGALPP
jgi:hypothetical protein